MKVKSLHNQSLFDISVQEYGTIEAVFDLALANNTSVTNNTLSEQNKSIAKIDGFEIVESVTDNQILTYYKTNNIKPVTGVLTEQIENLQGNNGIGYMAIESTFIVN